VHAAQGALKDEPLYDSEASATFYCYVGLNAQRNLLCRESRVSLPRLLKRLDQTLITLCHAMQQRDENPSRGTPPDLVKVTARANLLLALLSQKRQELDVQNRAFQGELQQRDAKITQLENDLQQRDAKITRLENDLQQRDAKITQLENDLQQRDAKITQLENDLQQRDAKITRLENDLQEGTAKAMQLNYDPQHCENEVEQKRIGEIVRSTPWRLTLPLRTLRRLIRSHDKSGKW
jgi:uncharacterized protein (DUF3084 family)